ncbi:6-phosphogluconolactonase [Klebsiella pneumoniae]|uniref:6-phosphogluconolactonase n=1 Tax=Klebsiella pneumoniae TaxID=573 RepID=A0A378B9M2_KLEPN|nr:6-phosphogluconolactonase [Klebsiella pneumoniae]
MPVARHLLVASLSLFAAAAGAAQTHYAWVGTYNPNGEGLYRFTVDAKTGALRDKTLVSSLPNVAQLTVSRDGKTLYAASEVEKGVVQAWRIEKKRRADRAQPGRLRRRRAGVSLPDAGR